MTIDKKSALYSSSGEVIDSPLTLWGGGAKKLDSKEITTQNLATVALSVYEYEYFVAILY